MQNADDISNGEILILSLSLFITMHREATNIIWQTEPMISTIGVIDSWRRISFGAGTANHIKFGSIIIRKITKPEISNPNLYFLSTMFPP